MRKYVVLVVALVILGIGSGAFAQQGPATGVAGMLDTVLARMTGLIQPDTLIGQPVTVDGITFVPVIKASIGFGGGGGEGPPDQGYGAGAGAGLEMEPISFLVIRDGEVSLISASRPTSPWVDIIMEFLPLIMEGMGEMSGMMMPMDMMGMDDYSWMFEEMMEEPESLPSMDE